MSRIIIDKRKVSLEYSGDCLVVREPQQAPKTIPLGRLDQLVCLHSVHLSTQLIGQLHKRGIDLVVINQRHQDHGFALFGHGQKQVQRRCRQYQWQLDEDIRLPLAKSLCQHKFRVIERLINTRDWPLDTRKALWRAGRCRSEGALRGIEGSLQRQVFEHWRRRIPRRLGFERRQRRPPKDPVNATLSFAYTLVHQDAIRQARQRGLDPQLGFYHRTAFGRDSLACDLMEPVRPRIEAWVTDLFRQGHLDKRHFSMASGRCLLGKSGRRLFFEAMEEQAQGWRRQLDAGALWLVKQLDQAPEEAP